MEGYEVGSVGSFDVVMGVGDGCWCSVSMLPSVQASLVGFFAEVNRACGFFFFVLVVGMVVV